MNYIQSTSSSLLLMLLRIFFFLLLIQKKTEAFLSTTTTTQTTITSRSLSSSMIHSYQNNKKKNVNIISFSKRKEQQQQRKTTTRIQRMSSRSSSSSSSALFTTMSSSSSMTTQNTSSSSSSTTKTTTTTKETEKPIQLSMMEYTTTTTTTTTDNDDTPILFLHGLLGSKRNFNSLATTLSHLLSNKNRPIFGMDLRNHGESPTGDNMSYDIMAKDVIHTLDQFFREQEEEQNNNHNNNNNNNNKKGKKKVIVIGHSMGGKVAASLALLYPERIEGLVVLDMAPAVYDGTCVAWSAVRDIVQSLATRVDMTTCTTKRDVDLQLRSILPDPALRAFVLTNIDTTKKKNNNNNNSVDWSIPISTLHHQLSTLAGFLEDTDTTTTTTKNQMIYTGDVFFIAGGQSKFIRSTHLNAIQTYFPNHMITTIRGAGHWLHAEAPDDVLALLVKYLER